MKKEQPAFDYVNRKYSGVYTPTQRLLDRKSGYCAIYTYQEGKTRNKDMYSN